MTENVIRKILVGFDSSDEAEDALRLAEALRSAVGGELIVASVDEGEPIVFDHLPQWRERVDAHHEADFAHAAAQLGRDDFTKRAASGSAPAALDQIAEFEGADVIVVGSTHRGPLGKILPGSVGDRLFAGAPCAVAIAPVGYGGREHPKIAEIGVAYDGAPESRIALQSAVGLARDFDAGLRVIAVTPTLSDEVLPGRIGHTKFGYLDALHDYFRQLLARGMATVPRGVDARPVLLAGDPAHEIAGQGVELDLLILGSRGYGPLRRTLLGGVASEVAKLAPCPVVVLPRSADESAQAPGASNDVAAVG